MVNGLLVDTMNQEINKEYPIVCLECNKGFRDSYSCGIHKEETSHNRFEFRMWDYEELEKGESPYE